MGAVTDTMRQLINGLIRGATGIILDDGSVLAGVNGSARVTLQDASGAAIPGLGSAVRTAYTQWVVADDSTVITVADGVISEWIDVSKYERDASTIFLIMPAVTGTNTFQLDVDLGYDGVNLTTTIAAATVSPVTDPLVDGANYALSLSDLPYAPYIRLSASGTVSAPTLRAMLTAQGVE